MDNCIDKQYRYRWNVNETHPYSGIDRKIHQGGPPLGPLAEGPQNTKHAPEPK